ncbi:MAG: 2-C-methyl-D-erythritol 4-phosphate cytidylyltransferase [Planctomycetota bacterium]
MPNIAVILAAAGGSSRFKDQHYKKQFAILNGKAVWLHSAEKFLNRDDVKQLIVVVSPEDRDDFVSKFGANLAVMGIDLATGGKERSDSVQNALSKVREEIDLVCIHDAARPCLADTWLDDVIAVASKTGAAILATEVTSTVKRSRDGKVIDETVPREHLYLAQTPQVFSRSLLVKAFAAKGSSQPTDEAQMVEKLGQKVSLVAGSPLNIKITTKSDLAFAAACLKALPTPRFDAPLHPFADDKLWR